MCSFWILIYIEDANLYFNWKSPLNHYTPLSPTLPLFIVQEKHIGLVYPPHNIPRKNQLYQVFNFKNIMKICMRQFKLNKVNKGVKHFPRSGVFWSALLGAKRIRRWKMWVKVLEVLFSLVKVLLIIFKV